MTESLKSRCELFVSNRDIMKDNIKWESSLIYPLCAYIYTERGLNLDAEKVRTAKDIIKHNVGIFSNFRGISQNVLATMLSLDGSPEKKFNDIKAVYSKLKVEFLASAYLPLAAFVIAQMKSNNDYDTIVTRTKSIYKLMKSEHPFLTSGEDCTFSALFAISDKPETDILNEAEACYAILKGRFFSSNAVQSLSHALALGEEKAEPKCSRTLEIYDLLKDRRLGYGTTYELATLGVLALSNSNTSQIVNDIYDVNEFLKSSKGFGAFSIGAKQRLMYAAMLTSCEFSGQVDGNAMHAAALNSITSLIIAQKAALTAAIAASTAASAGAGS